MKVSQPTAPLLSGIRSRLILLVMLCLVPVALVLIYAANENRRITGAQAIDSLSTIVELIDNDFKDLTYASTQLLTALSLTPERWLSQSTQCNQKLADINKQFTDYNNIYSVDTEGNLICSATGTQDEVNLLDRNHIKLALGGGPAILGRPTQGKVSKEMVLPVALPLYDDGGQIIGAMGVSIGLSQFLNQNQKSRRQSGKGLGNVTATLWCPDGTVLARSPDPLFLTGHDARESELFQTLIKNFSSHQSLEVKGLDNQPRWYAFNQIGTSKSGILLSVGLPTSELFSEVDGIYWRTLAVWALVSLLVVIAAWFVGEIAVRRPVSRLADLAEQVSQGKRGIRVGKIFGAIELKALGQNFDQMVEHLESHEREQTANQAALTQAKHSLELKVRDRTAALEKVSDEAINRASLLEKQRRDIAIMNELTDMLQSCNTLDESWPVIGRSLATLFDNTFGIIYIYRDSGNALVEGVQWGTSAIQHTDTFPPEDCWSLRLGRSWLYEANSRHPVCDHVINKDVEAYICVPMLAEGKTLGVLHIELPSEQEAQYIMGDLAQAAAARLALALSNIKLRQTLHDLSMRDVLTGLYNRRFIDEVYVNEISRNRRNNKPLSVLMIDVDHFKRFNDTYGHEAGDVVLKAMGGLLKLHFRKTDLPCRLGGEEFLVILPECDAESAMTLAEALRQKISELILFHHGKSLGVLTASIGVASWPTPFEDDTKLISAADAALYAAKKAGRDQVRLAQLPRSDAE
ncbi:MAG: diguanylate cyclase [Methylophaga sp.]